MNFFNEDLNDIENKLNTDKNTGLTDNQVEILLKENGKNELPKKKEDSVLKIFISQFINPIEIILVITVILSFIVGETIDAWALVFIILVDVIIGTYEEWKANKDSKSLLNLIKVKSKVIRNNKEMIIDSSELVIGDIVLFESGDKISIDGRIVDSKNFQIDESSLTGESINVNKNSEVIKKDVPLSERTNMVYAGTSVITGRAKVIVTQTGVNTEIGKIANNVINTKEEKSPLTIRIEKFSKQITIIMIIVAIITAIVLKVSGYETSEIFLSVIALSVSAMPEGLPLALTMALTIASKRMLKKNVIVKKLNSVESLGSCTVIASDKTGTLTVNEQTAKEIILKDGSKYEITGTGYNDDGEVVCIGNSKYEDAYNISYLGYINNEAHLDFKDNNWEYYGDSIDVAFLSLAKKMHIDEEVVIKEIIPYESENGYSAVFYEKNKKLRCTIKGSLEKIMSFSEENDVLINQNKDLTSRGYRVIAICDGEVKNTNIEKINKLDYIGMIGFIDPIRKEVKKSINECTSAGIKVVMITGDHPLTAFAISKDLGLCKKMSDVVTGDDIEKYRKLGTEKFDEFIKNKKVFSRVTPLDKLDIVNSFKRMGEFVAVTGDGVNDSPALKSANIGIAMGSGTDVAKDTADMIIIDDNFTSIVEGIKEGRCAYSNIRKITMFLLGCGFSEVAIFLLSILFGYDIPLVAIQLLWLNVVTDGLQDIALSFEPAKENILEDRIRSTSESLFSKELAIEVIIRGLTITTIVFGTWLFLMRNNIEITYARSIIMMLMVFIQNMDVFNCRSEKRSIFKVPLNNPIVFITIIGSIILQLIMAEIPIASKFLKVIPLNINEILIVFLLSVINIIIFEIYKYMKNKRSIN